MGALEPVVLPNVLALVTAAVLTDAVAQGRLICWTKDGQYRGGGA